MNVFISVAKDFGRFFSIKNNKGRLRLAILVVVAIVVGNFMLQADTVTETPTSTLRQVTLAPVSSFGSANAVELIGTVRALNEAMVQSETSGRVVAVPVTLGQTVGVGTVLARLENASQYAAVLQAEGAYEAAVASGRVGDVSLTEAQTAVDAAYDQARNTYESTFVTVESVFYNQLDTIYADPNNVYRTPGFSGADTRAEFNLLRDKFFLINTALDTWEADINTLTADQAVLQGLTTAEQNITTIMQIVGTIESLITNDTLSETYDADEASYLSTLSNIRSQMTAAQSSIRTARTAVKNAENALERAALGNTNSEQSAANAQIKQALGSLRAAQAAYNKTVITAPIAGQVNELDVQVGDFVGVQSAVAMIVNDNAYEITFFVSEKNLSKIAVGDSITINDELAGTITNVAPGINQSTGKIEVKAQSSAPELTAGNIVRISLNASTETSTTPTSLSTAVSLTVPLTALKLQSDTAFVFTVNDDNVLQPHEVELGQTRGAFVTINGGIAGDKEIVTDARGLSEGQRVAITN